MQGRLRPRCGRREESVWRREIYMSVGLVSTCYIRQELANASTGYLAHRLCKFLANAGLISRSATAMRLRVLTVSAARMVAFRAPVFRALRHSHGDLPSEWITSTVPTQLPGVKCPRGRQTRVNAKGRWRLVQRPFFNSPLGIRRSLRLERESVCEALHMNERLVGNDRRAAAGGGSGCLHEQCWRDR
jgi:hypothetical protein